MTAIEVVSAALEAVFGGDKQDDDDDIEAPPVAAAPNEGPTIEVLGQTWPRVSDERVALLRSTIALAEREEMIKIGKLQAAVSDAAEARNARLEALRDVDRAVRVQLRIEIAWEASEALQVAWPTYRSGGQIAEAAAVGRALSHAWQREYVELGSPSGYVVVEAFVQVVWGDRPGSPSDPLLNACARAVEAARSGSVIALQRALGDVEQLAAVPLS